MRGQADKGTDMGTEAPGGVSNADLMWRLDKGPEHSYPPPTPMSLPVCTRRPRSTAVTCFLKTPHSKVPSHTQCCSKTSEPRPREPPLCKWRTLGLLPTTNSTSTFSMIQGRLGGSVKCPTSVQVMNSRFMSSSPAVGLCADSSEPRACFGFCSFLSLSAPPPPLSRKNKH